MTDRRREGEGRRGQNYERDTEGWRRAKHTDRQKDTSERKETWRNINPTKIQFFGQFV